MVPMRTAMLVRAMVHAPDWPPFGWAGLAHFSGPEMLTHDHGPGGHSPGNSSACAGIPAFPAVSLVADRHCGGHCGANHLSLNAAGALNSAESPNSGHGVVFSIHVLLLPMRVRRTPTATPEGPQGVARAAESRCKARASA